MNTHSLISDKMDKIKKKKSQSFHLFLTGTAELAQGQLHEVEGPAHQHQDADVGNQEGTAPILVSREGKPPDISKT